MKKDKNIIEIKPIDVKYATVCIEGDGDLVLNKMNARTVRERIAIANGEKVVKEVPNFWEDIITAIHWRDGYPVEDTYHDLEDHHLREMLRDNAPCITGFGLKKSFGESVTRNGIDKYSTKLSAGINVLDRLVPIKFTEHFIDESVMSPKKGSPIVVRTNRFTGWSAEFRISYTENVYSLEQIVNIINWAGFGLGIGSGRSSNYGRYHVVDVR